MTINNDFCRKFWTPDYTIGFKHTLSKYNFEGSSKFFDGIVDGYTAHHRAIEDISQKKGAVMLALCIAALAFLGFEDGLDRRGTAIGFYFAAAMSFIILLFPHTFIRKWKRVVLSLLVIAVVTVLGYIYTENLIPYTARLRWLYDYRKIALVIVLLFPIIHQLFINWMHSGVYLGYLNSRFSHEYDVYERSMQGVKQNNRDMVEEDYFQAFGTAKINNSGQDSENVFTEVLKSRLKDKSTPGNTQLICSWLKYRVHRLRLPGAATDTKATEEIPKTAVSDVVKPTPALDFAKEYNQYETEKQKNGRLKLKEFCHRENINYKDMHAWVRVFKSQKASNNPPGTAIDPPTTTPQK